MSQILDNSELGKKSKYTSQYDPSILFAIPRESKRKQINVQTTLPFKGVDIWSHFEVSWLDSFGKPIVAIAEIIVPCESPNLIESKSMKLYFNSFNNTKVESITKLTDTISHDLSQKAEANVRVTITPLNDLTESTMQGICLDSQQVNCSKYTVHREYLTTTQNVVSETLYSNLLKSNCPVTAQPDWGSLQIEYTGPAIEHSGLLKYIVSFRDVNDFHEQCIERIFTDITDICKPTELTIYGRYTRRGGLDINVFRSTKYSQPKLNKRTIRQ